MCPVVLKNVYCMQDRTGPNRTKNRTKLYKEQDQIVQRTGLL